MRHPIARIASRLIVLVSFAVFAHGSSADVITFESLVLPGNGFYSGDTDATGPERDNYMIVGTGEKFGQEEVRQIWTHQGVQFSNNDIPAFDDPGAGFDTWSGWSPSRVKDDSTPGFGNQFAARPGTGSQGSDTYLVAFTDDAFFNIPSGATLQSVDLTNTTYAARYMADGDDGFGPAPNFEKKYGGASGSDPDYFRVVLSGHSGLSGTGGVIGEVPVDLADFTFDDDTEDFVLTEWIRVSLASIADARSVTLRFESSDTGPFGINTPTYVALDNLTLAVSVPEPSSFAGLALLTLIAGAPRRTRRLCNRAHRRIGTQG